MSATQSQPLITEEVGAAILHELRTINARLQLLEKAMATEASGWVTGEEAAQILGLGSTRPLQYARTHGFLTKFASRRPYRYDRNEVKALAEKVRSGKVYLSHL